MAVIELDMPDDRRQTVARAYKLSGLRRSGFVVLFEVHEPAGAEPACGDLAVAGLPSG
jgi:hypothetical protein